MSAESAAKKAGDGVWVRGTRVIKGTSGQGLSADSKPGELG